MHTRAQQLIDELSLRPHPEGGHFRELYRSPARIETRDNRLERAAVTTIYFLLTDEGHSRWHSVTSDEIWHFYEGDGIDLFVAPPSLDRVERAQLSGLADDGAPVRIVPAGWWQAARTSGAYSLLGCTVSPGFEFADFTLLRDDAASATRMRALGGSWHTLL